MSSNTLPSTLFQRTQRAALVALSLAFVSLASVSCNGNDDGGSGMTTPGGGGDGLGASGVVSLLGPDTSAIGTEFTVGDVAREMSDSFPVGYLFVDAPKMFTADEFAQSDFDPSEDIVGFDPQNTTLLAVVVDEGGGVLGVSLGFRLDGLDYGYTCTGVAGTSGQPCGDVVFDQDAGEFIFNGVILEPTESSAATDLLTLDTVISITQ